MRKLFCKICGSLARYHNYFDAYFCGVCNTWMEQKCEQEKCRYCCDRPERPLRVEEPAEKKTKKRAEAKKEDE